MTIFTAGSRHNTHAARNPAVDRHSGSNVDTVSLPRRLQLALESSPPDDYREAITTLLDVYALHLAPLDELGGAEQWQHHPRVSELKLQLEARFRDRLDEGPAHPADEDAGGVMRRLAHRELVPPLYDWLAEEATVEELVDFISIEGGPDANFDDLVALCQIGLRGTPKLTLGWNYWDEMGRGELSAVHTELHHKMVDALGVRSVPVSELPLAALERSALNGYLATNRALHPEMIGGLGMIECQAGPRCRKVVTAMRRLDLPDDALAFYAEHATADPHHGKDWIDHAIQPLAAQHPTWLPRITTGARWRLRVNQHFFTAMSKRYGLERRAG
jgi:hypothetical protein